MIAHIADAGAAPQADWLNACRLDRGVAAPSVAAECGELTVPENPAEPDGTQISLSVAVVPALNINPLPDPLILIAGGPGQSTVEFYLGYQGAFAPVRLNREIVLIDQRGTGASNPLVCPDVARQFDESTDPDVLRTAAEACLAEMPGDARYYTTSVAVADLDNVRRALGYEAINLYGISYGTRVAQHYMRRYPDATRRVILDGVVNTELVLGPGIAIDAQRALDSIFGRCASEGACATRFPNLADDFTNLMATVTDTPETVVLPDPVSGRPVEQTLGALELGSAMRLLSYSPLTSALLPLLIDEAANNANFQPLAAQVQLVESQLEDSINIGMHNAVVCTEDVPFFTDLEALREPLAETYLGAQNVDGLAAICDIWPAGPIDADFKEPLVSDIPTLLLSGEFDPVTPPAYAKRAAEGLRNHQHIVGPAYGHGLAPHGCVPRLLAEFLEAESALPLDASCVDKLSVMPFFVDFAGPAQ